MSSLNLVQLHSSILFNISDSIARSQSTTSSQPTEGVGIFLGYNTNDQTTVIASYELVTTTTNNIDLEYLYKRFIQFKAVSPNCSIVGFYQIKDTPNETESNADTSTIIFLQQIQQALISFDIEHSNSPFYIVFKPHDIKNYQHGKTQIFQSYSCENFQPIKTIIDSTETENIATSTISKHKKYFTTSKQDNAILSNVSVAQHTRELANTLDQLHERMQKILQYLEELETCEEPDAIRTRIHINNSIVHLANMVASFKQSSDSDSTSSGTLSKLQAAQLSLITEELTMLERLKAYPLKMMMAYEVEHQ